VGGRFGEWPPDGSGVRGDAGGGYTVQAAFLSGTYHRTHGIRYFHGCYCVGDDQLWGVVRERKGADHTLAALKSIRAARPGGYRLFVIMDNLSANKTLAIRRWAKRENVELCFTPVNALWANPIEAQFGPIRTFVMGGSDYPNHTALAHRLQAHLRWRNANARHADVLAAQRRHPQRTPATLGPPKAQAASRITNTANVRGQHARPGMMSCMVPIEASKLMTQMRRGAIEYCVLALLRRREWYGFELAHALAEADGLVTSEGTIYPLLSRLRRDGVVDSSWRESPQGPPRRYYSLTSDGMAALSAFAEQWATFRDTVDRLLTEGT
jgi:DNA-binding PadR family transcriptional regulator